MPSCSKNAAGRPRQPVADDAQRRQVDAEALITDHADVVGEGDAGLVDGERVPRRAGTQAGIGERVGPSDRHRLGLGEPGGVHHGADDGVDTLGLQLGDRRGGKRCGVSWQPFCARPARPSQLALARRGWARSACRPGRCRGSAASVPCRSTVRTTGRGRRAALRRSARCSRLQKSSSSRSLVCSVAKRCANSAARRSCSLYPGQVRHSGGVPVELFVDTGGGPVGIAGVDADDAFVVVGDHGAGEFAGAQRQPVFGVDRVAEVGDRAAEVGRFRGPAVDVVVSELSDSAHGVMVRPRRSERAGCLRPAIAIVGGSSCQSR